MTQKLKQQGNIAPDSFTSDPGLGVRTYYRNSGKRSEGVQRVVGYPHTSLFTNDEYRNLDLVERTG